jgi:hypothetical protein
VEKKLQNIIDKDSIGVNKNPTRAKIDDWSDVLSSEGVAGVLLGRAHTPELRMDLEVQQWLVGEEADWEVSEL